jgi:hypothetical protein
VLFSRSYRERKKFHKTECISKSASLIGTKINRSCYGRINRQTDRYIERQRHTDDAHIPCEKALFYFLSKKQSEFNLGHDFRHSNHTSISLPNMEVE